MAAATADRDAKRTDGQRKSYPVAANTEIFKGTLVGTNSGGYLVPMSDVASLNFEGVAYERVDNNPGANGDLSCRVEEGGEYEFVYAGGDAVQARVGDLMYAQDDQTVDEDAALTTNDYPVGFCTEVVSVTKVRVFCSKHLRASGAVVAGDIGTGAVTTAKLSANAKGNVDIIQIEDLGAGVDITARAEFAAPAGGGTLTKIGIVPKGASAGIDNANTVVIDIKDAAGNTIVSKTYNTGTQPPAAQAYGDLGALDATHKVLTANEVVTVAITQGATADLPACLLVFEWDPAA